MTLVKICGLTTLADASHAAYFGADLLGFIQVPASPRYIPPATLAAITGALRAEGCSARLVGVFGGAPIETVQAVAAQAGLDLVQLHGDEPPAYARAVGVPTLIARRVRGKVNWDDLERYDPFAYLLDGYAPDKLGGTGQVWDWSALVGDRHLAEQVIIAGGLNAENVAALVSALGPLGVDASSGVEQSPGRKDPAKVRAFLRAVREAATRDPLSREVNER